jgi:hypothetical protein
MLLAGLACAQTERRSSGLKGDERPGKAHAGAIEKQAHSQRLSALHRDKPHLPAHVVGVRQFRSDGLIGSGIFLKAGNAGCHSLPEPRTDFIAIVCSVVRGHRVLLAVSEL